MTEPIPADRNFVDLVLQLNGEKMAHRGRAEEAEARVAPLEAEVARLTDKLADSEKQARYLETVTVEHAERIEELELQLAPTQGNCPSCSDKA